MLLYTCLIKYKEICLILSRTKGYYCWEFSEVIFGFYTEIMILCTLSIYLFIYASMFYTNKFLITFMLLFYKKHRLVCIIFFVSWWLKKTFKIVVVSFRALNILFSLHFILSLNSAQTFLTFSRIKAIKNACHLLPNFCGSKKRRNWW